MIYELEDNWIEVKDPVIDLKSPYPLNKITYEIIGSCFDVYNELGKGFLEIVYKDALQIEFNLRNIQFEREKKYEINYKGFTFPRYYLSDFVINNNIILEVKAQEGVLETNFKQIINYLAISKCKIGLLVNFGENSLKYKRIILTK
ncbi:MAG TPA: GxxExxY protein [Bacteroidia bacterium]|jgi:GxxExxY protein|nr:GxxExxY protein [Bacteroidia bacterium]